MLTHKLLESLARRDVSRVVYSEACRIGREWLGALGITFKQLPYELKVS